MALPTLENILNIVRRTRMESRRSPGVAEALRSFFKHMESKSNPDLYFEAISGLETANQVISDAACKLYCLFMHKPAASTTDAWMKGADHATVPVDANGAADLATKLVGTSGGNREYCLVYHDGLPLGTGLTVGSFTTQTGNTKSAAADAWVGFAIIGAP